MAAWAGAVPGLAALAQGEQAALLALPCATEGDLLSPDVEAALLRCDAARLWAGEQDLGSGALVVTSARVAWIGAQGAAYQLEYPQLIMHAVCTDQAFAPSPCIYCQLALAGAEDEASDCAPDEAEDEQYVELRIVPQDPAQVGVMFAALSRGAALFPCPDDEDEDADEGVAEGGVTMAGLMMDGLQLEMGLQEGEDEQDSPLDAEERARRIAKWDALLQEPAQAAGEVAEEDGQFDDAESASVGFCEPSEAPPS